MPNKTSNGKSGGGNSVQWNPTPTHMLNPQPTMTFSKGRWAPAPTGSISTFGDMQTVSSQPGQLPAIGQKGSLSSPVMPAPPAATQHQPTISPDIQQRWQSANPFVRWLFMQRASRRGMTPLATYQDFWNTRHQ